MNMLARDGDSPASEDDFDINIGGQKVRGDRDSGMVPVSARYILILNNLRLSLANQGRFCTRSLRDGFICREMDLQYTLQYKTEIRLRIMRLIITYT